MRQKFLRTFSSLASPFFFGTLLIAVIFFPLIQGKTLLFGDNFSLMVPGKLFSAHWLTKGVVPLWNPTQFAGLSWVGDINQSLFYPSTLLFILFQPSVALNITLLSHLLLSFLGAYFLAREISPKLSKYSWLLVAVFWSFSPQLMGALNNFATFQSISYVPWIVLCCLHFGRRRENSWLYVPVLITLQLLGGYPQHVFFSVLFGVALSWLFQENISSKKMISQMHYFGRWTAVGLLTILLSTFVWLPFVQNLNQSTRSLQTDEQAQTGSLRPDDLVKIITPTFFDNPSVGYKWGPGWNKPTNLVVYFTWIGMIATAWCLSQKKKQKVDTILFGSVLACLLFSFSDSIPLFSLLQKIPIIGSSRGVTPILAVATLAGSILVGRAVFSLKIPFNSFKRYFVTSLIMSSLLAVLWLVASFYFEKIWVTANYLLQGAFANSAFHSVERDRVLFTSILFSLSIQSFLLLLTTWLLYKRKLYAVVLIIFFDLVFFTKQYYFFGPSGAYNLPSQEEVLSQVKSAVGSNYRLLTRNYNAPYADFGAYADALILRQPFSDSFVDAQERMDFSVAVKMKELLTPGWNTSLNIPTINGYTTLLPASLLKDFGTASGDPGINRLPEIPSTHEQLKKWAVGYYLVDTWYPDYDEQFPNSIVTGGEGWKLYQLPNTLSRIRYQNGESANITAFEENPNELQMVIDSDREQDLLVADRFDSDWRATVNGRVVKVSNSEGMRLIPLEKGTNEVRMWYSPTLFYSGIGISSSTLLGLVLLRIIMKTRWQTK